VQTVHGGPPSMYQCPLTASRLALG
jgi:hypothetical protein